ncbi:MAG TPA: ABC transporter substrate-binding protein [Candidatus Eisenbergiella stercorigallinarum]|uniref:ABC transporter substrate-binding protein n=2 Tax=Eisenbergiella TaxID=1432051 RepID=A0A9D2QZF4_9FIRM|nr:ABC transporter substrate-binding protein [Candidatus Eisenbergiella intestinigallinarum]HJD31449.1 ABC transporter substrate-binding protein [Candidatus Eisenbergiella stercorigallinarum]
MKTKAVKRILLTLVCGALTIALGACSGDKAGESSSQITIGIPQDIEDSLDPHKAVAAGTKEVLFNLYEGLVKPDSSGELQPAIASDYSISEDATTYTFTLREGVKFHDGSMVTAEDVKYSIDRCADTTNGEPLVEAYSNIKSVNIVDEKTVEVVLNTADSDFLANMTTAIIPASNENPDTNPIGTGPYRYVSRSPQENFVVEKFDEYWGTPANIENVTFRVCANADSIVMNLQGGSIDMFARLTTTQASQLGDQFDVLEGTMNLVQALYLNNAVEPFNDERVRQALCYAVDPQGIMDLISDGKGTEIGSSMFPAFEKYYMPELNDVYNQDFDKAKELLAEAGYPDGFSFTITVPSNYQQHIDTAQVLVEQLKNIGVTAEIELVEWETWVSEAYTNRNFEATVVGVDASSLTASALLSRFVSDAPNNFINFSNADYDAAYARAEAAVDDEEKTEAYKECERLLAEHAANVYIQDLPCLVALNKKYAGYEFYPLYVQDISKLYIVEE